MTDSKVHECESVKQVPLRLRIQRMSRFLRIESPLRSRLSGMDCKASLAKSRSICSGGNRTGNGMRSAPNHSLSVRESQQKATYLNAIKLEFYHRYKSIFNSLYTRNTDKDNFRKRSGSNTLYNHYICI